MRRYLNKMAVSLVVAIGFTGFSVSANPYQRSPDEITAGCATYNESYQQGIEQLISSKDKATYDSVVDKLDDLTMVFYDALLIDYLIQNTHTDKARRDAATACALSGFAVINELSSNRALYNRISMIETKGLPEARAFTVNYWKEQFKISGIGEDKATREKIKVLNDEISEITNQFELNINSAVKTLLVKPERLAGLPQDYIDAHPANEEGLVTITSAYSDVSPIYKYAHDREFRKEVAMMMGTRAMPENQAVLMDILEKRQQLASTLGHKHFAHYDMLGTMVASPDNAAAFTAKLSQAIEEPVKKEKARLLKRMQMIDPDVKAMRSWDSGYVSNIIQEQEYQLDAKEVREYFHYDKVRDGILQLSEDLFGIEFKAIDAPVWHDSVESYEVHENGKKIGLIHLDSHPRDGKYTHAAQFPVNLGKAGVSMPEGALLMNFPKGLMEHGQVETFLHEFGHLVHFIFAGQNHIALSRFQSESDFGEAPSMMLEEWVWDYDTLKNFATNSEGKVIPKELVDKMSRARYFGQAIGVAYQLTYTALSLDLYNRYPEDLDLESFEQDIFENYAPYGFNEGAYMHTSFGHLASYGAKYYTYQWSQSIAEELLSRFKQEGLRNKKTAADYRNLILAKTGTKPAAELVKDFLGRDFSVDAYAKSLSKSE